MSYANELRKVKAAIPNILLWIFPYLTFYHRRILEEDPTLLSLKYDTIMLPDDPFHLQKQTVSLRFSNSLSFIFIVMIKPIIIYVSNLSLSCNFFGE